MDAQSGIFQQIPAVTRRDEGAGKHCPLSIVHSPLLSSEVLTCTCDSIGNARLAMGDESHRRGLTIFQNFNEIAAPPADRRKLSRRQRPRGAKANGFQTSPGAAVTL